jgi:hypothetical protein
LFVCLFACSCALVLLSLCSTFICLFVSLCEYRSCCGLESLKVWLAQCRGPACSASSSPPTRIPPTHRAS